jgi:hypothetical protein
MKQHTPSVSIIMHFNSMYIHINKSMVPTKTHSKKNQWFIQDHLHFNFILETFLHWKFIYIGKLLKLNKNWIEKLLTLKKIKLKKYLQ